MDGIPTRHDYPAFLSVERRRCVVVGGGPVGAAKAEALVSSGALVTVVAPEIVAPLADAAGEGRVRHVAREYRAGDLAGAFLVVAATGVADVDEAVRDEAVRERALVNVVDAPDLSDFIVPAVVRRGPLQIAVSTGGTAPAVARDLRRRLEDEYGEEWAAYLTLLGEVRVIARERVGDAAVRRELAEALTDPTLLARVAAGERPDAERLFDDLLPEAEARAARAAQTRRR